MSGVMPRHGRFELSRMCLERSRSDTPSQGHPRARPQPLDEGLPLLVDRAVENQMRIIAPRQEALKAGQGGTARHPEKNGARTPVSINATLRRMKARMTSSPISADPMTIARRCGHRRAGATHPSDPPRLLTSEGRPASWLTSPVK